jgi:hypothetical protein
VPFFTELRATGAVLISSTSWREAMHGSAPTQDDALDHLIDLGQPWQRRWWSREFGISEDELRAAIEAVGPSSAAVRRHVAAAKPA